MKTQEDNKYNLILCSPPYGKKRKYGQLNFRLTGQNWVDWCVERWVECDRICKGLVAWVVDGGTKSFQWDATPALLIADLHRRGIKLRKPPIFHRVGIPGSGGNDWWRSDYEPVLCSSHGKLPWSDNTANGSPCKFGPGGVLSHRMSNDVRVNVKKVRELVASGMKQREAARSVGIKLTTGTSGFTADQDLKNVRGYYPPERANAGNVIHCSVGGSRMGHKLAHSNEAPFPVQLAEPFVKCFCPPGGTVLDIFCGSSSAGQAALKNGRNFVGIDIRQDQIEISRERLSEFGVVEII